MGGKVFYAAVFANTIYDKLVTATTLGTDIQRWIPATSDSLFNFTCVLLDEFIFEIDAHIHKLYEMNKFMNPKFKILVIHDSLIKNKLIFISILNPCFFLVL